MPFLGQNSNVNLLTQKNINFGASDIVTNPSAPLAKPIQTVQKSLEDTVEILTPEGVSENEKKSNKKAIAVGSSVLVVTALVALLNPKYSSKFVTKLKTLSESSAKKFEQNKQNYLKSKFHKACQKTLDWGVRILQFSNNINSAKDIAFTKLCCEKKSFLDVKNKTVRKVLQKADGGFTKVMSKVHHGITRWFDKISKKTVLLKYDSAMKKMNELDTLIKNYKSKLNPAQQVELEKKLAEIAKIKDYFAKDKTAERLVEQEKLMTNLERDFMVKFRSYRNGFRNKWVSKPDHISKNMTFWAEEILEPTRAKVEKQGANVVETLIGNPEGKVGLYDDIYKILSPNLNTQEKEALQKLIDKSSKKLKKANFSECVEYFDKKRDLVLGGAPTDIVTAVGGLALSGVAVATADTKEDKISKALTGGFPIIAGIGANLAFTAMLFSGVQGLLCGFLTSIGLSKIGSILDNYLFGNKNNSENNSVESTNVNSGKTTQKETINV